MVVFLFHVATTASRLKSCCGTSCDVGFGSWNMVVTGKKKVFSSDVMLCHVVRCTTRFLPQNRPFTLGNDIKVSNAEAH